MPVSSRYPDVELAKTDIYTFLFGRKKLPYPGTNVIYQDADIPSRKYTYNDVAKQSLQFGQGLKSRYDIQKGDVIALFTPNDIDYAPVVFGALWTGAVVSPANPGYTVSELAYQLKDSTAKLIVTHHSTLNTVLQAAKQVNIPQSRIVILGAQHDQTNTFPHWTSITSKSSTPLSPPHLDPTTSLAFLVYSSGTTGRPKGVMLTHQNLTSNVLQITACEAGKLSHDGSVHTPNIPPPPPTGDKILSTLPFFHIYGLTSLVLTPLHNGIHTVVLAKFSIEQFCSLIQTHGITFIYIVPPMALLLAKHPCVPDYNLSSVRITNSGAAPLTRELQESVFKRTGIRIKQGYGLSETSPTTHEQRFEDWNVKIGTIGRLQPNMQAKFCEVGAEGDPATGDAPKELPIGETGELYMKGPNVFAGYWRNEAATRECLSSDGWFRTGDVGHVDADGDFYITDRVKELIKYKGFQVAPAELEGYLIDNELVDDVVVVGVVSERLGTEIPRAYVVRKGGMGAVREGDAERIIKWLDGKVVNYKKLRGGVKFVEAVPKSASGKLLRRLLKDQARKEYAEEEKQQVKAKL